MKEDIDEARLAQVRAAMAAAQTQGGGQTVDTTAQVIPSQTPSQARSSESDRQQRPSGVSQGGKRVGGIGSPQAQGRKKPKVSPFLAIRNFVEDASSEKGLFVLGGTITVISIGANWMFYSALYESWGVEGWFKHVLGLVTSLGTTVFQVYPDIPKKSTKVNLRYQFALAAKPDQAPESKGIDTCHLKVDYKWTDRNHKRYFEMAKYASFVLEAFLGFIYIGNVGTGMAAVGKLVLFLASIAGANFGVNLMIRSGNLFLPIQVEEQFKTLVNNDGSKVNLKNL